MTGEEASFPDTADSLEEGLKSSTKRLAEWTFSLQGVSADLRAVVADIKAWARTQMAHWTDRGPRDHESDDKEGLRDLVRKAVRATIEIQGDYNEGGNGSSPQWRNWVMTMLGTLIVIGIASLVTMYANQKAMGERMDGFERRIANIEHKIWP